MGTVARDSVEDVAASASERDQGLVVFLMLGSLLAVMRPRHRVLQRRERGQKQGSFEDLIAATGRVVAVDRGA